MSSEKTTNAAPVDGIVIRRRCFVRQWNPIELEDCHTGEKYKPESVAPNRANYLGCHGMLVGTTWHPDG